MASIRELKKDFKKMVEHFIQECYTHLAYSPPTNLENVLDIISDATELRREMLARISAPKPTGAPLTQKARYDGLAHEFYDRIVELTERLNSLSY